MSGFNICQATDKKDIEKHQKRWLKNFEEKKDNIRAMKERGDETYFNKDDNFSAAASNILEDDNVFPVDNLPTIVIPEDTKPPKGFERVETIEGNIESSGMKPKNSQP